MMTKFAKFIIKPFLRKPLLYIFTLLLISFRELYGVFFSHNISYLIQITLLSSTLSYFILITFHAINNKLIKNAYLVVSLGIIILSHIISFTTQSILQFDFNEETASIIAESNIQEISEFIRNFVKPHHLIFAIILSAISFIAVKFTLRFDKISITRKAAHYCLLLPVLGTCVYFHNPALIYYTFIGTIKASTYIFRHTPDLKPTLKISDISIIGNQPQNVVMIIGESYNKKHSQIYGYEKETTPNLKKLFDNDSLIAFKTVVSPATHTIGAFTYIMTTHSHENPKMGNWYEKVSIPELANKLNYKTYWISNQNKKGLYDNISGKFANLCSHQFFTDNTLKSWNRKNHDAAILPHITTVASKTGTQKFLFIHLMGQHIDFKTRYPQSFQHFTANHYPHLPSNQKEIIANYDNATLYNDHIVAQIISKFKDTESIIIMTADHGLDLFQSTTDYYGNAKGNSSESHKAATQIPLMIYASKSYRDKFPEKYNHLKLMAEQPFNTDNLIYLIMDIVNVKISEQ